MAEQTHRRKYGFHVPKKATICKTVLDAMSQGSITAMQIYLANKLAFSLYT